MTSFNKVRGSQIRESVITNLHISENAAIAESKLDIDWASHSNEILSSKLLVDFVQVNEYTIPADSDVVTLEAGTVSAAPESESGKKGAVIESGKNKVILRKKETGEPIISTDGFEVYAELGHTGDAYTLTLFANEVSYVPTEDIIVDFQFPQRFDLLDVIETFASNEKFVDGASDVSTRLDLTQIIKDAFGLSYDLTQDGEGKRPQSIVAELADQTRGLVNRTVRASVVIDEVVIARAGFLTLNERFEEIEGKSAVDDGRLLAVETEIAGARGEEVTIADRFDLVDLSIADHETRIEQAAAAIVTTTNNLGILDQKVDANKLDLASTDESQGASLIGVADRVAFPVSETVQDALVELAGRVGGTEVTTAEVEASRTSTEFGVFESLDERLEATDEALVSVRDGHVAARNSEFKDIAFTSVDERLEAIEFDHQGHVDAQTIADAAQDSRVDTVVSDATALAARVVTLEASDHRHFAEDYEVLAGDALIDSTRYDLKGADTFTPGDKTLQVYINGMLQMLGVHYTEALGAEGKGVAVVFAPEKLSAGDIVQLRWTNDV